MNNNLYMSTLLKAFDILDCFTDDSQELGISDISALVGLPVSSVHRIIQSLEFEGLLSQNRENKKYALGSKMLSYSQKCGQYQRFQQIASKYADELCRITQENVNVATGSGDQITNIYTAETHFILRPSFPVYTPFPIYCTGVGRVFLSHMSEAAQKWVYESNASAIPQTQEEFLTLLRKARQNGYALDDQAFNAGLRCVAAPIYCSGDKLLFAMSVSAPLARMDDEAYKNARQLVMKYAERISQEIQDAESRH